METYYTHNTQEVAHFPKIGIVLSVYNGEDTLHECMASLLGQTLIERDGLHIFAVDDGSSDSTLSLLQDYKSKYPELFTIIAHATNRGLADGRNSGLEAARTSCEFVGFVDADDVVHPRMFEDMLSEAIGQSADIAVCDYAGTNAEREELFIFGSGTKEDFGGDVASNPRMLFFLGASVCNKIFRVSLFEKSPFPSGLYFEDLFVTYSVAMNAQNIVKCDSVFYYYRLENSSSIMGSRDWRYFDLFDGVDAVLESAKTLPPSDDLNFWLSLVCVQHLLLGRMNDVLLSSEPRLRREFASRAYSYLDEHFPGWEKSVRNCSRIPQRFRIVSTRKWLLLLYTTLRAYR